MRLHAKPILCGPEEDARFVHEVWRGDVCVCVAGLFVAG